MLKRWFILLICSVISGELLSQRPSLILPNTPITEARFSSDGKKIITDKQHIWDAATGYKLFDMNGSKFNHIDFVAENIIMVTSLLSTQMIFWNPGNGVVIKKYKTKYRIQSAVFTEKGGKVAAHTKDGKIVVWNVPGDTGHVMLRSSFQYMNLMIFDQSGNQLATVTDSIRIWNTRTGNLIVCLPYKAMRYTTTRFSPDGERIAADDKVIFDAATGRELFRAGEKNTLTTVIDKDIRQVWYPDNNSDRIAVKNIETGLITARHTNYQHVTAVSNDGKKLIATTDSIIYILDSKTFEVISRIKNISDNKYISGHVPDDLLLDREMHFSPDDQQLLTVDHDYQSGNNTVRMWNTSDGSLISEIAGHTTAAENVEVSNDGKLMATSSLKNTTIGIWNLFNFDFITSLKSNKDKVLGVVFSKDNKCIVTKPNPDERYSGASVWDSKTGMLKKDLNVYASYFGSKLEETTFFSPQKSKVLCINLKEAKIFDTGTGDLVIDLKKRFNNSGCTFSADDKRILVSINNRLSLFDLHTQKIKSSFLTLRKNDYYEPVFSPDGGMIIIQVNNQPPEAFDTYTGKRKYILNTYGEVKSVKFSHSGMRILVRQENEPLSLYDAANGRFICSIGDLSYSSFGNSNFTEDDKKIIVDVSRPVESPEGPASARTVEIHDASNGKQLGRLSQYISDIDSEVIPMPGSKRLLTLDREKETYRMWDIDSCKPLFYLQGIRGTIGNLVVRAEQNRIYAASSDNNCYVLNYTTGELLATLFVVDSLNYIAQLPSGYYKSSPGASKKLHYVDKFLKVISFEQLDTRFNRPDLVLKAIGSPDTAMISAYHSAWIKRIKKLGIDSNAFRDDYGAPACDFLNRRSISRAQTADSIKLVITSSDSKVNLTKFNLWINETPLFGKKGIDISQRQSKRLDTTITARLSAGENRIEVSVINSNGIESFRYPLFVKYNNITARKQRVYFVGIGMDRFSNSENNLRYCRKDISDLARNLKIKFGENLETDTLFNEKFTSDALVAIKQKLLQATEDDKVIVAYSGHGLLSKNYDYYLSTYYTDFSAPEQKGIAYEQLEEIIDGIKPRKKLMLIDACHSGELDKDDLLRMQQAVDKNPGLKGYDNSVRDTPQRRPGLKNSFELMQELFLNVGRSTGATVICASTGTQFAIERGTIKNGVFTSAILETMQPGKSMTVEGLKKYVSSRVSEITNNLQQPVTRTETLLSDWEIW